MKKVWTATLRYISTRTIPGPPVVKLHLALDRDHDRRVEVQLRLDDRRRVADAIEHLRVELLTPVKGVDPRD